MNKKIIILFIVEVILTLVAIACYTILHPDPIWGILATVPDFTEDFISNLFHYCSYLLLLSSLSIVLSFIVLIIYRKNDKKQKIKYWLFFSFANLILALLIAISISIFNHGYCVAFC